MGSAVQPCKDRMVQVEKFIIRLRQTSQLSCQQKFLRPYLLQICLSDLTRWESAFRSNQKLCLFVENDRREHNLLSSLCGPGPHPLTDHCECDQRNAATKGLYDMVSVSAGEKAGLAYQAQHYHNRILSSKTTAFAGFTSMSVDCANRRDPVHTRY